MLHTSSIFTSSVSKVPSSRVAWCTAFVVCLLGILSICVGLSYDVNFLLYSGDGVSHLLAARKFIDNRDFGPHNIGTVWLPLQHVLLIPFSMNEWLFRSGLAGACVSLPALALFAFASVRIAEHFGIESSIASAVTLSLTLNPALLYLGCIPMTETLLFACVSFAALFLLSAESSQKPVRELAFSAFFLACATLTRYESWFSVPLFGVYVAWQLYRKKISLWTAFYLSIFAAVGIFFWFWWNWFRYGSALQFLHDSIYSTAAYAALRQSGNDFYGQPFVVGKLLVQIFSLLCLPTFVMSIAGLILISRQRLFQWSAERIFGIFLLLMPFLFLIIALLQGVAEMRVYGLNMRYAFTAASVMMIFTSIFWQTVFIEFFPQNTNTESNLVRVHPKKGFILIMLTSVWFYGVQFSSIGVGTYVDARGGYEQTFSPQAREIGRELSHRWKEYCKENIGKTSDILLVCGSAQEHQIAIAATGIPFRRMDEAIELFHWKESIRQPWQTCAFVVVGKEPFADARRFVEYWTQNRVELEKYYRCIFENSYYTLWERKQR